MLAAAAMSLDSLPDLAAHRIVERLAGHGIFQLLALASLSKQWRSVVGACRLSELRLESKASLHNQRTSFQGDALSARFLQLPTNKKTDFFISAARLFRQHNAVYCCGEAISDLVILEVAKGTAHTFCIEVKICDIPRAQNLACMNDITLDCFTFCHPSEDHCVTCTILLAWP